MDGIMAFSLRYLTISPTVTTISLLLISLPVFIYTMLEVVTMQTRKKQIDIPIVLKQIDITR
ncbi:hypothetical protein [Bacillus sp. 165]|uniref:hypothetical protein n=1 Tax=Bacillus sp. 165 TaxID=1529117 RepID=UPI001ADB53D4|nr:hypothetical protein [Bacillus sp. 165]MBO9128113.1 hypothetical protein [Bacillus sp. 165]